jgi:gamma-glutamylcyclotransferase (GGCT)/AIG2-like uncharacterized protein YtfP
MPRLYIAYGSNLNLQGMQSRCPTAEVAGTAVLKDYQLRFRDGLATVEPKPGAEVPVLVWDIQPGDEKRLDNYEGWPSLYRKENVTVEMSGKPVSAMVYIMNGGHRLSPPGKYYYDILLEGYRTAGFDARILENAIDESLQYERPYRRSQGTTLYIAYGSNINKEQMRFRCPTATLAGKSALKDYELLFREGVACVEPKPGGRVPVLLWKLKPRDEYILDQYERRYHQEEMTVPLNGKPTAAMIYMMDEGYMLSPPNAQYYNTILRGYRAAGFDRRILDAAVHESAVRFEEMPEPELDRQQMRFDGMDGMKWW